MGFIIHPPCSLALSLSPSPLFDCMLSSVIEQFNRQSALVHDLLVATEQSQEQEQQLRVQMR